MSAAAWSGVDIDEFPHLKAWEARMLARPGVERGRHVPSPHRMKEMTKEEMEKLQQEGSKCTFFTCLSIVPNLERKLESQAMFRQLHALSDLQARRAAWFSSCVAEPLLTLRPTQGSRESRPRMRREREEDETEKVSWVGAQNYIVAAVEYADMVTRNNVTGCVR